MSLRLVFVKKYLYLENNGHMVPLSTNVTFEVYNYLMIYNYSFQMIDFLNSFELENPYYGGIHFKTYAKTFVAQLVETINHENE